MMVGSDVSAPPFIFNFHCTSFSHVQECLDYLEKIGWLLILKLGKLINIYIN